MRHALFFKVITAVTGLIFLNTCATIYAADTLPLSDKQIQILRAYLPPDHESSALVWQGDPLLITLGIHIEKRIIFAEPIEANLKGALNNDQLRVINNDQSLYLTALKPFEKIRLYVSLKQSNKIILIDLATSDEATHIANMANTIKITSTVSSGSIAHAAIATTPDNSSGYNLGEKEGTRSADQFVRAIRFAWQQRYAPERLLPQNSLFSRTPMRSQTWVSHLVYGDKVFAHPEVSWLSGDLYVTAIELRNKYPHPTTIDLRHDLCGQWAAATLYPRSRLKPAGDKTGDHTTLFVLSEKPFGDVLEGCDGSA